MGGANSCLIPRNKNPNQCRENHTSTPRLKGHRRNLSAAFNLADMGTEMVADQLNINSATEEQLMTLPLINRATAHNIVDYRQQIGAFKRVEDLALVSGVGANKLNLIRLEICVGRKKSSTCSSQSSSKNDLSSGEESATSRLRPTSRQNSNGYVQKMNVNTSNVFQLMKVRGISQNLAERIVSYRDKHGYFRRLDDLVRVKGVSAGLLSAIRPQITMFGDMLEPPSVSLSFHARGPGSVSTSSRIRAHSDAQEWDAEVTPPSVSQLMGSQEDLLSMYGPLARRSLRAKVLPPTHVKEQRKVLRVATWNLQDCSSQKADNPGVKDVIGMTLLENGFDIVAVQELSDSKALQKICDELNNPLVPNLQKWPEDRGLWDCVVTDMSVVDDKQKAEYLGFLYNQSSGIELVSTTAISLLRPSLASTASLPLCGLFKVDGEYFVLVNVHVQSAPPGDMCSDADCSAALNKLSFLQQNGSDHADSVNNTAVILGDFGAQSKNASVLGNVKALGFEALTDSEVSEGQEDISSHHIYINSKANHRYAGATGQVTDGLTSLWIPDGWNWGGAVSKHHPFWAELYVHLNNNMS